MLECTKRSIPFEISLIFGLPNQTVESFKSSVQWALDRKPSKCLAFPLMLLRGTELYDRKKELGLIESTVIQHPLLEELTERQQKSIPHVVSSPSFTCKDWKDMASIALSLY